MSLFIALQLGYQVDYKDGDTQFIKFTLMDTRWGNIYSDFSFKINQLAFYATLSARVHNRTGLFLGNDCVLKRKLYTR